MDAKRAIELEKLNQQIEALRGSIKRTCQELSWRSVSFELQAATIANINDGARELAALQRRLIELPPILANKKAATEAAGDPV
jgi:hypothetical protein